MRRPVVVADRLPCLPSDRGVRPAVVIVELITELAAFAH